MAAAKVQRLHQLHKYDIVPEGEGAMTCTLCNTEPTADDLALISDLTMTETQNLLNSCDTLKQKVVYIAGFLFHKHFHQDKDSEEESDDDEHVTSEFLEGLSRGGLRVPRLNMVFLVHSAIQLYGKIDSSCRLCTNYFRSLLSLIDSLYSNTNSICKRLINMKCFIVVTGKMN